MWDDSYRESKRHGDARFPFDIYPCTIPRDMPQVALHWQESMELVFIKHGEGMVQAGPGSDHLLPACAGDIFIFVPGALHGLRPKGSAEMQYENIIFELSVLGSEEDDVGRRFLLPLQSGRLALPAVLRPGHTSYLAAATALCQLEEANKERRPGYELAVRGTLLTFLAVLLSARDAPLPPEDTVDTRRLKEVLRCIESEYSAALPVARAAAVCGLSPSHFMRWFRQMTGQSFTAFLNEYRLNAAAALLRRTDCTILSAAEQTGFENLSNFNRQFKRRYGMSPSLYRRV